MFHGGIGQCSRPSFVCFSRRAGRFKEAARLLNELARSERIGGSLLKKQIYVLAAMLADQGKANRTANAGEGTAQPLVLLSEDNLWRYAQVRAGKVLFFSACF